MPTNLIPVAQYLRKSTEHQQYSHENQASANLEYAEKQGFTITRTYSDPAKSGFGLKGDLVFGNCCRMSQRGVSITRRFWFMTLPDGADSKISTNLLIMNFCANQQAFRFTIARRPLAMMAACQV